MQSGLLKICRIPLKDRPSANENYHTDIVETAHYYTDIYHQLHKNHEHFLGLYTLNHRNEIDCVFNADRIVRLASLQDKDLNRILIDKKNDKFRHYTKMLEQLHINVLDIYRDALKCKLPHGKSLKLNEKLQILELLDAYRVAHASISEFIEMIKSGVIDIQKLRENLLLEVMKSNGYSRLYMGGLYNDVPCEDLPELEGEFITVLGKVLPDDVYLDSFNGWISPEIETVNRYQRGIIRNNID